MTDSTTATGVVAANGEVWTPSNGRTSTGAITDKVDRFSFSTADQAVPAFRTPFNACEAEGDEAMRRTAKSDRAAQAFQAACVSRNADDREQSMYVVIDAIDELWLLSDGCRREFQDLIGLLDAALRGRSIDDFTDAQLGVLQSAFQTLRLPWVQHVRLQQIREAFVNAQIDILRPLQPVDDVKLQITVSGNA